MYVPIPFGKAKCVKEGTDITLIATGFYVKKALDIANNYNGGRIEIIDPRTLFPLDKESIYDSVKKTGRVVIVTEETKRGAWSAEIAACIAEDMFEYLKSPIVRVGSLDTPMPYVQKLEEYVLPSDEDIIDVINEILSKKDF